jgi:hypothetical protein
MLPGYEECPDWPARSRPLISRVIPIGFLMALLGPLPAVHAEPMAPPSQVFTVDLAGAGARDVIASQQVVDHQSDQMANFSLIGRTSLGGGPFYFSGGVRGERFDVGNSRAFSVQQLQDYGAQLSLEYYVGAVKAAYLTISPGLYYESHATWADWDVPVEFATGIPMTSSLNGLVGIAYGRFWHHPTPIAGFMWTISERWKLVAAYPDPSLVCTISDNLEASLAGELLGNGFRTDAGSGNSYVVYHVYRVGGNLAWQMRPGFKITTGAGVEYERVFDFWRAGQSFRATSAPYARLGIELSR